MWPVIGTITSSATKREYVFQQIHETSHVCSNFCKTYPEEFQITSSTSKFRRKCSNSKHKEHIWRNHHHMQFHFQKFCDKTTKNSPRNKSECFKRNDHLKFLHVEHMVWSLEKPPRILRIRFFPPLFCVVSLVASKYLGGSTFTSSSCPGVSDISRFPKDQGDLFRRQVSDNYEPILRGAVGVGETPNGLILGIL